MNNIDRQYKELLEHIIHFGVEKKDRTGTGTKSLFGWQIRHRMEEGFPLLTTKKMAWKSIVTELLWFLRGDTNIKYLVDNGCHIWDGDAYKNYLKWFDEQSKFFKEQGIVRDPWTKEQYVEQIKLGNVDADLSELGPIYGKQWRRWSQYEINMPGFDAHFNETQIDQIANLISELKTNPDSRRLMVNAWNVGELDQMVLPPCHFSWQCYSHEQDGKRYLSLAWNQRSVDCGLGLPFNIASYGLLLEIIAKTVDMIPYELIGNLGDCHIYNNHIDGVKQQLERSAHKLPKLKHMKTDVFYKSLSEDQSLYSHLNNTDFELENYQSHPPIKLPLSN
jgi:thymidylate synthase